VKDSWPKYALLALAAVSWWFLQGELTDFKASSKTQWQEAARTKDCLKDELAHLKARVAHIEGFHEAERQGKGKGK